MTALKVSQRIRDMLAEWATNTPAMAEDFRAGHLDWSHLPQMLAHFEAETLERAAKVAEAQHNVDMSSRHPAHRPWSLLTQSIACRECATAIREMIGRDG